MLQNRLHFSYSCVLCFYKIKLPDAMHHQRKYTAIHNVIHKTQKASALSAEFSQTEKFSSEMVRVLGPIWLLGIRNVASHYRNALLYPPPGKFSNVKSKIFKIFILKPLLCKFNTNSSFLLPVITLLLYISLEFRKSSLSSSLTPLTKPQTSPHLDLQSLPTSTCNPDTLPSLPPYPLSLPSVFHYTANQFICSSSGNVRLQVVAIVH